MRISIFLTLLLSALIASAMSSVAAEDTNAGINGIATAANRKFTEIKKIINRLRGKQKLGGEERMVPVGAYWLAATGSDSDTSSTESVMHAVEDGEPLSKLKTAIGAIIGIALAAGAVYGGIKFSKAGHSGSDSTSS
ncbi:unnamed protein product [Phytophthora fragariaefolia]|uniref:Unnamed protein product n=1 Tax=Phytophthora fragariaefolia TaxID=1490495 RepID=A0A9W6XTC4_9STRA|nr:unnamed protein product [Phytophthora fragariaefolia]